MGRTTTPAIPSRTAPVLKNRTSSFMPWASSRQRRRQFLGWKGKASWMSWPCVGGKLSTAIGGRNGRHFEQIALELRHQYSVGYAAELRHQWHGLGEGLRATGAQPRAGNFTLSGALGVEARRRNRPILMAQLSAICSRCRPFRPPIAGRKLTADTPPTHHDALPSIPGTPASLPRGCPRHKGRRPIPSRLAQFVEGIAGVVVCPSLMSSSARLGCVPRCTRSTPR